MFEKLIKATEFSILSHQNVLSQSVVEVLHEKIPRGQEETCNTLYDLRMGTIEKGVKYETCSTDYTKCKRHFGRIALGVPVVNLICLKTLKWIRKHICKKCKRTVLTKQAASCFHCSTPQISDDMFDVDMSTFCDNKGQQFDEKISLFGYEAQCKGHSMPCFSHQHLLRQWGKKRAGILPRTMHSEEKRRTVTY